MSFKFGDRSTSDYSELTASYFPFYLLSLELGPTMFVVISRYSTSENDFCFKDRHLLTEFEADDKRPKIEGLFIGKPQWQSKSTVEMSYCQ